jgi:hypothetical protein
MTGTEELVWAPGTTRAVRGSTALQLGTGPGARLVEGMTADDWALLARLERGVPATADRSGLLGLLTALGVVHPAREVQQRGTRGRPGGPSPQPHGGGPRAVAVVGGGGLGALLVATLAAGGATAAALVDDSTVRAVDVLPGGATAADVGRRAVHAAAEAVHRVAPDTRTACPLLPDLVVLVAVGAHDAPASAPLVQQGTAHLPVLLRDRDVLVGPLVLPGRGPCLHCVDLLHRDVDRSWPDAVRALRASAAGAGVPVPDPVTCGAVAAVVGRLAAAVPPPTRPPAAGQAVAGAAATVDHRGDVAWERWPAHPGCGCTDPPPWDAPDAPADEARPSPDGRTATGATGAGGAS